MIAIKFKYALARLGLLAPRPVSPLETREGCDTGARILRRLPISPLSTGAMLHSVSYLPGRDNRIAHYVATAAIKSGLRVLQLHIGIGHKNFHRNLPMPDSFFDQMSHCSIDESIDPETVVDISSPFDITIVTSDPDTRCFAFSLCPNRVRAAVIAVGTKRPPLYLLRRTADRAAAANIIVIGVVDCSSAQSIPTWINFLAPE